MLRRVGTGDEIHLHFNDDVQAIVLGRHDMGIAPEHTRFVALSQPDGTPPTRLSRRHAMFRMTHTGEVTVADISSGSGLSHGVFVNDVMQQRAAPVPIRPLDVISLGPRTLRTGEQNPWAFQYHAEAVHAPIAKPAPLSTEQLLSELSDAFQCGVCFETAAYAMSMSCGHVFCGECLCQWVRQKTAGKRSCPTCKTTSRAVVRRREVDDITRRWIMPHATDEEWNGYCARELKGRSASIEFENEDMDPIVEALCGVSSDVANVARGFDGHSHQIVSMLAKMQATIAAQREVPVEQPFEESQPVQGIPAQSLPRKRTRRAPARYSSD